MPTFKYTIVRTSRYEEVWYVEASSEEEALEKVSADTGEPDTKTWIDYDDDEFHIDNAEVVDPLYVMVRDYAS